MADSFFDKLKTIVIPYYCLICNNKSDQQLDLCLTCQSKLKANKSCCRLCANPLLVERETATLCGQCQQEKPAFDKAVVPWIHDKVLAQLHNGFKFHQRLANGRLLAELFLKEMKTEHLPELLLPVPLHQASLRQRGFNQALELTKIIAKRLNIAYASRAIKKTRISPPQVGLKKKDRKKNLHNAFALEMNVISKDLAIVDDVMTTGSTVNEIALLLKKHGARRVDVWCVARQPLN